MTDPPRQVDLPPPVEPLPRAALVRLKLRKLCFPEAQHIGLDRAQPGHLADAVVELVRYLRQRLLLVRALGACRSAAFLGIALAAVEDLLAMI